MGKQKLLRVSGRFEFSKVRVTEIQGKSILVRVSARFELARVRIIPAESTVFEKNICISDILRILVCDMVAMPGTLINSFRC